MTQDVGFQQGSGGATIPADASQVVLYVGLCSAGTPNTVYSVGAAAGAAPLGIGPLADAVRAHIDDAGRACLAVPVTPIAGSVGAVTKVSGAGVVIPTLTGTPADTYIVRIRIAVGGAVGTAKFEASFDGGVTYEPPAFTAASIPRADLGGLTLGFPVGTYVAGDVFGALASGPTYSSISLLAALDAALAGAALFGYVHVLGEAGGADDAAKAAASAAIAASLTTKLAAIASGPKRVFRLAMEVPQVADAALQSAWAGVAGTDNLSICAIAGWGECELPLSLRRPTINLGRVIATQIAKKALSADPSAFSDGDGTGPLPARVRSISRDERVTPGLNAARFTTTKTFDGYPEIFYLEGMPLFAQAGSKFQYVQHGQVMDRALTVGRAQALYELSKRMTTDAAGFPTAGQAAATSGEIDRAIRGEVSKHSAGISVEMDRTVKVSAGFVIKLRIKPFEYAKSGTLESALVTELPQVTR